MRGFTEQEHTQRTLLPASGAPNPPACWKQSTVPPSDASRIIKICQDHRSITLLSARSGETTQPPEDVPQKAPLL